MYRLILDQIYRYDNFVICIFTIHCSHSPNDWGLEGFCCCCCCCIGFIVVVFICSKFCCKVRPTYTRILRPSLILVCRIRTKIIDLQFKIPRAQIHLHHTYMTWPRHPYIHKHAGDTLNTNTYIIGVSYILVKD